MPLPASTASVSATIESLSTATAFKAQMQQRLSSLSGTIDSDFVFSFLDQTRNYMAQLNAIAAVSGINASATSNFPGYTGTLTSDIGVTVTAIQNCISDIVTAFPKDSTNTWILSHKLNADGSRTPRTFTSTQTSQLSTDVQALINTIS